MVNTNWNLQGVVVEPGLRFDLRYEHIRQDQPMNGSRKVGVGELTRHHDEITTSNNNYLATVDYTHDDRWGIAATLPYLDRSHDHIHNHRGERVPEHWDFDRVGDARVLGRYQWHTEYAEAQRLDYYGVNFGVKLPTGSKNIVNAAGTRAERTLQPGTGTTDLLVGGYYTRLLAASDASWFVQGLVQAPLAGSEGYRPGRRVSLDMGYRYEATDRVGLMLQLNLLHRARDSGPQAEPEDTGGKFVALSPGASYAVTKAAQVYGFVQKPIYQYVNGVQLVANWSVVLGVAARY